MNRILKTITSRPLLYNFAQQCLIENACLNKISGSDVLRFLSFYSIENSDFILI